MDEYVILRCECMSNDVSIEASWMGWSVRDIQDLGSKIYVGVERLGTQTGILS